VIRVGEAPAASRRRTPPGAALTHNRRPTEGRTRG
jgi:hypothetical protein